MAETGWIGSFWNWIVKQAPDWLGDALMGALLVWILGKRPGEGGAKGPLVDVHGELFVDLHKAVPDMSQPIWQRHKAAVAAEKDDEWEALMSKVPKDARPEVYVAMNKMEDEQFEQCLDLLRHNRVLEFLERVALYASPKFKAAWTKVKATLDNFNAWLDQRAQAINARRATAPRRHNLLWAIAGGFGIPFVCVAVALAFMVHWLLGTALIVSGAGIVIIWKRS